MNATIDALRDGAFSRKVLNFAISIYALTTIYATLFTPARIQDGQFLPEVKAHQHIVSFIHWLGLTGPANWIQTHLINPALNAPGWTYAFAFLLVALSIALHALRGPSTFELPAQPSYGVVLSVTILVDFQSWGLFVTALLAAATTFVVLLFCQEGDWDKDRFGIPLLDAALGPILVVLNAPLTICAYIAVAPTERPLRVRVVNSELDAIHTQSAD